MPCYWTEETDYSLLLLPPLRSSTHFQCGGPLLMFPSPLRVTALLLPAQPSSCVRLQVAGWKSNSLLVDRKYHTNFVLNLIVTVFKFRGTCGQVIATFADVKPPSPRISHPFRSVCVCPVMAPTTESRRAVIVKEPQKVGNRSNITTASCSSGNRFSHVMP